jgi:hypothetical protein
LSITIDKSFKRRLIPPRPGFPLVRVSRADHWNDIPTVDKAAFAKELNGETWFYPRPSVWISETLFPFAGSKMRNSTILTKERGQRCSFWTQGLRGYPNDVAAGGPRKRSLIDVVFDFQVDDVVPDRIRLSW